MAAMTMQEALEIAKDMTFEKFWASMVKLDEKQAETSEQIRLVSAEAAQRSADTDKKFQDTDKQIKDTWNYLKDLGKKFADVTDRLGEIVEHLVSPDMENKFRQFNFDFHSTANGFKRYDMVNGKRVLLYQIDVFLENGDSAMAVEVKTKVKEDHIDEHIDRLEKIRAYADKHGDKRSFYGAIAGAVFPESVKNLALKKGFYVIEQSGDTLRIEPPLQAKRW
jgi:hypothetical protein